MNRPGREPSLTRLSRAVLHALESVARRHQHVTTEIDEAAGFDTWLVNAGDVKHLPGRPKTDRLDAVWLRKVSERQMPRPGFVPPP